MQLLTSGWARFGLFAGLACSTALCGLGADAPFRYQGFLGHASQPAAGLYDFTFSLHTTPDGLEPLGSTLTNAAVTVQEGRFTTELDFGTEPLNGQTLWLEIGVRPSAGDESFQTLTPRQQLTSTPYAVHALGAQNAAVADVAITVPPASVTALQIAPDTITGDRLANEQVVRSLNGLRDDLLIEAGDNLTLSTQANSLTLSGSFDWRLSGNSDTLAGKHFIGTLNAQPLEFRVNGNRALRLEPTPFATVVNVVGGSSGNFVRPGTTGATIAGGGAVYPEGSGDFTNSVHAEFGTIGGGYANSIGTNAFAATITGGHLNSIQVWAYQAAIGGGSQNRIGENADRAFIGGGSLHQISAGAYGAVIDGGISNTVSAYYSTIGGGSRNAILDNARYATIAGGGDNFIDTNSFSGAIGGGGENRILGDSHRSTIAGGKLNQVGVNSPHSAIGGGLSNRIADNTEHATIPGGRSNLVSAQLGLAAGNRAQVLHPGSFVWADAADHDFATTNANEFAVRARGGVRFVSAVDGNGDSASGVVLEPGEGSWSTLSDREAKVNFTPIQPGAILEKVVALPIQTWSYQGQLEPVRHLGPVAQDFHNAFGLGGDSRRITTVDADGVALAAIQGLHEILREKSERIAALEARNAELLQRLEALEERFTPAR
ncbi:MAG: tail fiber domain-containing protein [Verrucomicrobia bacterium]|nr:tail fiber domain-containing protein [Verrucomicrobiota bacterium]